MSALPADFSVSERLRTCPLWTGPRELDIDVSPGHCDDAFHLLRHLARVWLGDACGPDLAGGCPATAASARSAHARSDQHDGAACGDRDQGPVGRARVTVGASHWVAGRLTPPSPTSEAEAAGAAAAARLATQRACERNG
jgi:hypothetical protein